MVLVNSDLKDGIDFSIMKSIMNLIHKLKYKKLMTLMATSILIPQPEDKLLKLKSPDS
jgi:hypothetical protein